MAGLRVPAAPGRQGDEARHRPPGGHPRRGRHPPGPAVRPPQPHRRARGARPGQAGGAAADAGVPRRPQRPLRDLPRQRAQGPQPGLPDERRARRDLAPLGPPERRHQPRVGRAPRLPPGQADVLGAPLVAQARGRDGARAGHVVRRTAGRRPPRAVRPDRRPARPRALHPPRARAARVGLAPPVPHRERPPPRGGRGARAPRPASRHRGRRGDALRVLRRAGGRRRRQRPALRPVVEAGPAEACGPAHLRPGTC